MGGVIERRPRLLLSGAIAALALAAAGCTADGTTPGSLTPQGGASELTPLVASATSLSNRGTRADVQASIPVFVSASTSATENHLQAFTGLGDAHTWMALNAGGGLASYEAALTAYTDAVEAATTRDSGNDLARARIGKARTLLAVEPLRSPQPQTGDRINYAALATTEYEEALRVATSEPPEWHYELARLYERANNPSAAIAAYRSGAALQPNSTAAVEALLRVALLQGVGQPIPSNPDSDEVLNTLKSAASDNPRSAAARTALGQRYFQRGDYATALTEFQAAVSPDATASSTTYKAEANYYLSVLGTRGAGVSAAQVASYAQAAIDNGGGSAPYRRQLCLAHIMLGGDDFRDGDSLTRCQLGDGAEASLLLGMYYLRLAQYRTPNSDINNRETQRWISDLTTARDQFTRSRELAAAATALATERTIDWAALSRPLATTDAADYGTSMVIYCGGSFGALFGAAPALSNEATANEFYGRYHLNDCSVN